jgi:prepilin-type N-terminal cleavage/methylation domain-containing protein
LWETPSVMCQSASSDSNRGFSLIETMAAIFVLAIALFAVLSVNAYTLRLNSSNQQHQTANSIASTQLAVVESILKSDFHVDSEAINTPLFQSTDFPEFTFIIQDQGYEDPGRNLRAVAVTVFWDGTGGQKTYELSTTFYNY